MAASTKICALFVGAIVLAAIAALILLQKIAPPADQSERFRTTNASDDAPPETEIDGTVWRELLRIAVRASRRVGLQLRNARIYGGRWMSADAAAQFISVDERAVERAGSFEFGVVSPHRKVELVFDLYANEPTLDSRIMTFHYVASPEGIDYMRSKHHGTPIECSPDLVIQGRRKLVTISCD